MTEGERDPGRLNESVYKQQRSQPNTNILEGGKYFDYEASNSILFKTLLVKAQNNKICQKFVGVYSSLGYACGYKKRMHSKPTYLMFNLPLTKSSQQRKTMQKSDEKQDCQYWMLRLVVAAPKQRLLVEALCVG